ncbi:MAG: hypothetical protein KKE39_11870 [Bacteroidetes bacterium]|nr:hypothetical protein [Bacteroidota bacterium]MBU1484265.1 hypothetical protein [Bacteroidota bacterium]MBU1759942.1 hypothetical protein [Bacteroidota bacterium]MBU2268211.1 hypothetical protein [Bacteroidota bacterium]MBU2377070.1 hypothetical protein [Bacteroidota bacterium]
MTNFIHNIDKNNFFYSSITTLVYAQFGINEMFSRGFMTKAWVTHKNDFEGFQKYIFSFGFNSSINNEIFKARNFTPLIFVPGFLKKDKTIAYEFDPYQSAVEFVNDTGGRTSANIELTHMTILKAFEKIADLNLSGDVFEFFRHVRNASAHNGKFHFHKKVLNKEGELLKIAKWENFEIKASMNGLYLIMEHKEDTTSFFDQGDLVEFLLDFENHYPEIKKN